MAAEGRKASPFLWDVTAELHQAVKSAERKNKQQLRASNNRHLYVTASRFHGNDVHAGATNSGGSQKGNMSSPRVGVVRDSMQTNPRIVKAPVGRSRPTALSGPGPDFTFGISSHSRDGGVAEVLSSWRVHVQRPSCSHALAPDFVSLNRDAVRSGAVTSKKLSQYRAQVGVVKNQSHTPKSQAARRPQSSVEPPGGGLGLQRQRSTSPLADLLSHQYGQRWIQEQLTRSGSSAPPRRTLGRVPDTRTSLLRKCGPAPGPNRPGVKAHGSAQEPGGPSTGVQDS